VKALSIAMGMLVSFAVGMRVKWRRVRVESTRAMLKSAEHFSWGCLWRGFLAGGWGRTDA